MNLFNPDRHAQNSTLWQFCIVLKNLGDPRLSKGVTLLIWSAFGLAISYSLVAHWYWTLPMNQPTTEDQADVG